MSSPDQNKSGGKSGRRNRKQQRSQKPDQLPTPMPDQQQDAMASAEAAVAPADAAPTGATASPEPSPIGFRTIATAYRDYTRKSFEEAQSYVEKLSGVRSFDKAFEVQTEFAKQAYETFVADSQKIRRLYSDLVTQTLNPSASRARRDT